MKHRISLLSLLILLLSSSRVFSQMYDKDLILSFMASIRPISDKDEGILSLDVSRKKNIKTILAEDLPFFYLPSTVSTSVKCVSGDCVNGYGVVQYRSVGAKYEGYFRNGYPDSTGIVTNIEGLSLLTHLKKGEMVGWQSFRIRLDTFTPLEINTLFGRVIEVKNMFWPERKVLYTGKVNNQLKPNDKNGIVKGGNFEAFIYMDYDGNVKGLKGKVNYDKYIYEGPLTVDMKFKSGGVFINKETGLKVTPRIATDESGRIFYDLVTIEKGDSMYIGSTNNDFSPHGRGLMRVNNKEVKSGEWKNGKLEDATGTYYPFRQSDETLTLKQRKIEKIERQAGINSWNDCIYKGSPINWFFLDAKESIYAHPTIYVFNTSNDTLNICVTPQISGYDKMCFNIPPTFMYNDSTGLELVNDAFAKMTIQFPRLGQDYTFEVSGAIPSEYYMIIK